MLKQSFLSGPGMLMVCYTFALFHSKISSIVRTALQASLIKALPPPVDENDISNNLEDAVQHHKDEDNDRREVLVTGLFWENSTLVVTYLNHGIQ